MTIKSCQLQSGVSYITVAIATRADLKYYQLLPVLKSFDEEMVSRLSTNFEYEWHLEWNDHLSYLWIHVLDRVHSEPHDLHVQI